MSLGIELHIIPLGFIANPSIIALSSSPIAAFGAFIKLALGLVGLSYSIIGRRKVWKISMLVAAGLALVFVGS